ncbi:hypothetical protein SAMN05444007_1206 [Cribrihabitans marinus]|uniref:Uncharacterized protein n=1 Tax=Cribrihabitans marinus TaxID=1227549 RepID=A0A1H7E0S4_9RHOB|nr:hypothetical protein [Cribrihabitans marinus]SEK07576.1 hypothetical protein SAMN05444007_1206 [Cribrihabitans marinus]
MDQIQRLGAAHGFKDGPLLELSRKLTVAQSDPLNLSQPELVAPKKDRGARVAQRAINNLRRAEEAIAKAQQVINELRFSNPFAHTGMPNPAEYHLATFREGVEAISDFRQYLENMKRNDGISYGDEPDRRKARDLRKEIVCWTIFTFWTERSLPLKFTTDPISSERGGDLFDFVNAIVECMTEPPTRISGETLKLDLKRYQDFCQSVR